MTEKFNIKIKETKEKYFKDCETKEQFMESYSKYLIERYKFLKLPQKKLNKMIEDYIQKYPNPNDENVNELSIEVEELMKKSKCMQKGYEPDGYEFLAITFIVALNNNNENETK